MIAQWRLDALETIARREWGNPLAALALMELIQAAEELRRSPGHGPSENTVRFHVRELAAEIGVGVSV